MDTDTLVESQIEDGQKFLARLTEEGFKVTAACWVKPSEDEGWTLYIATPMVDERGPIETYREALRVLRSLSESWLTSSDISLIGEKHPITGDVLSILRRHTGMSPTRARRPTLGGSTIEEVYVYPATRQSHTELNDEQKRLLETLYTGKLLAVDDLPYTEEMEQLHREFVHQTGLALTVRDVFKALKNLGRQGRLGGKVRTKSQPDPNPPLSSTADSET